MASDPYDVITADTPPPGVQLLALTVAPGTATAWSDVSGSVSSGPAGALTWTGGVSVVPGTSLAARAGSIQFDPPADGSTVSVQGVAMVDQSAGPTLLALWPLPAAAALSLGTGSLVVSMTMVVQGP